MPSAQPECLVDDLTPKQSAALDALRAHYLSADPESDSRGWIRPVELAEQLRGVASIQELVLWGKSRECYGILRELMHRGLVERREYKIGYITTRPAGKWSGRPMRRTTIVVEYRYVEPLVWPSLFMPKPLPIVGARAVSPLGS